MVYKVLKIIVRWCLKLTFKKIHIHGKENLGDGPYFIACNHPLGFMEPLILACFLDRDLHWLVRGDVFNNPVLKPLLVSTNQIPIFRTKDGFTNLRNNASIMSRVSEVLLEGAAITIFIEGSTKMVKHLRPLQKGMARMSLRTLKQAPGSDIKILPIGMCFTESTRLREEAIVAIGAPLSAEDYMDSYKNDKAGTINQLTDDTFEAMRKCMVEVSPEREELFNNVGRVWRSTLSLPFWPVELNDQERFQTEKKIATIVTELSDIEAEKIDKKSKNWVKKYKSLNTGFNPVTGIPGFFGLVVNYIPMRLGKWFADTVIESPEFYATIRMVSSLVAFLIYYLILISLVFTYPTVFWLPIASIILGILYLYHNHQKEEKRKMKVPGDMISEREEILSIIFSHHSKQSHHHE